MIFAIGFIMFLIGGIGYSGTQSPLGNRFDSKTANFFIWLAIFGMIGIVFSICKLAIKYLP